MVALKAPTGTLQPPLFEPHSEWRPTALVDMPSWAGAKRVGFDLETKDDHLKELGPGCRRPGNFIAGVSFAIEDGPSHYLPIRHEGGDNLDAQGVLAYIREQAKTFTGDLVGANLSYDLDWSAEEQIEFKEVRYFRDVQVAEPLIDELQMSYSLDNILKRHGMAGKATDGLKEAAAAYGLDPKAGMWRLPARHVGEYAEGDAWKALALLRRQEKIIDDQDLWDIYNLESQVLPVLVRMRRRGVRVDIDRLRGVEDWALEEEAKALAEVAHHTGVRIAVGEVWKPELLARALTEIGVVLPKTASGAESVTSDLLKSVHHPVATALGKARKVNKIRTTFAASVRTHMVNGRIHCTFNQLRRSKDENEDSDDSKGGRFGRLSCDTPNLQQQPSRDDEELDFTGVAERWRSIYIPEEGGEWVTNDFSQQEPRWMTHYAEACELPRAREAGDRYRNDPKTDSHTLMATLVYGADIVNADKAVFKRRRDECKQIALGVMYGMGGAKLCRKLKLPTRWAVFSRRGSTSYYETAEEARAAARQVEDGRAFEVAGVEGQAIIDKFDHELPYVRGLAKMCEKKAKKVGYITTILGRRCRMPVKEDGSFDWCHKALNRLIQGSSADQTKRAVVELDRAGFPIQLQVHDEIDFTVYNRQQAADAADIMRNCVPASVPFQVDSEIGPSWGEAK